MNSKQRRYIKALESLVYIANLEQRHYWALKVFYFADKEHLQKYGSPIFNETYIAMDKGPVPSLAYDIVKYVRGDGHFCFDQPDASTALEVPNNKTILPKREPDTKVLSKSEIECINIAYNKIKNLSFGQLKDLSHDGAYNSVDDNDNIPLNGIIGTLENKNEILEYLSCN